jgi:hypothetical protein
MADTLSIVTNDKAKIDGFTYGAIATMNRASNIAIIKMLAPDVALRGQL